MARKKQCPTCLGTGLIEPSFGERVFELRNRAGLTQMELARRVGMKRPTLANIEAGRQEIASTDIVIFARIFGVSTDHILGVSNDLHND